MTEGKQERRAGLRFAYLVRQLIDEGWSQTAIADAIGCHQTLISKWMWRGSVPHDLTRKGLRDDVIQGIYEGLGVRSDYLIMPRPKGYPNTIKRPNGETRPAEADELDYRDFRVVTNAEFEAARERKERDDLKTRVAALESGQAKANAQLEQILALLVTDKHRAR